MFLVLFMVHSRIISKPWFSIAFTFEMLFNLEIALGDASVAADVSEILRGHFCEVLMR